MSAHGGPFSRCRGRGCARWAVSPVVSRTPTPTRCAGSRAYWLIQAASLAASCARCVQAASASAHPAARNEVVMGPCAPAPRASTTRGTPSPQTETHPSTARAWYSCRAGRAHDAQSLDAQHGVEPSLSPFSRSQNLRLRSMPQAHATPRLRHRRTARPFTGPPPASAVPDTPSAARSTAADDAPAVPSRPAEPFAATPHIADAPHDPSARPAAASCTYTPVLLAPRATHDAGPSVQRMTGCGGARVSPHGHFACTVSSYRPICTLYCIVHDLCL